MNTKAKLALGFTVLFGAGWGGAYAQVQTQSPTFGTVLEYPTSGCDGAVLIVPLPGQSLLPKAGLMPSAAASFYGQAAALHVKWATSLQCTHTGITHALTPSQANATTDIINSSYINDHWSGYQISNTAQYAQAGWTIPAVVKPPTAYASSYYSSTWTGIGLGYGASLSAPLIQSGSTQDLVSSTATYYFWYEIVGGPADTKGEVQVSNQPDDKLFANPGDAAASVSWWKPSPTNSSVGTVEFGLCDFTTVGCLDFFVGDPSKGPFTPQPGNTTEWIVEAPLQCNSCTPPPLADFDLVTFANACWAPVVTGPDSPCYSIAQGTSPSTISLRQYVLGQYQYLALPGALNSSGSGYTDYYYPAVRGN
ncbi:MAG: G1 family glutamic endopeptidase [Rudaea sp.]